MFAISKRILLFLALNFLVVITISTILSLLGVQPYLTPYGLDIQSLAVFCLVWGMGGSLISLALSKHMAKWTMGVQLIPDNTTNSELRELRETVRQLATSSGIPMPDVGVYQSPQLNAFATGPTKNMSLVAVSSGLLNRMDRKEIRGVLAHEISHIANGDMVTMTLLQGVVNAFVMFLARVLAFAVSNLMRGRDDRDSPASPAVFYLTSFVFEILFMILGSIVVASFSRWREYRADAGGARLGGRESMIAALEALKRNVDLPQPRQTAGAFQSMQIEGGRGSWLHLFSSHPPLSDRINRLRMGQF